jgi:outer membrane protein assembly factor BamB
LEVRQNQIRRVAFSRKGAYLLLASSVVFLVGVGSALAFKKKLPMPQPQPDLCDRRFRRTVLARRAVTVGLAALVLGAVLLAVTPTADFAAKEKDHGDASTNWPRFRGPAGLGISPYTNVPTYWNAETGAGILWKSKVPLPGHNSPIVWGDRVFISGADRDKREVYCFDAFSGKMLWQRPVENLDPNKPEPPDVMEDTGYAAPTMVTDGRRACAIFPTGDIACFDYNGRRLWAKSLGLPENAYGHASSLAMYRNLVLVQYDQAMPEDEKSKLIAFDILSGEIVWQTKRPVANSWTTPIVVSVNGRDQLITAGDPWLIACEPASGAEIWRAKCLGTDLAPSPIYAGGLALAIEPHTQLVAVRPDGRGDVTETHIAWTFDENIPEICSPVSNGQFVFLLATNGLLTCVNVADGRMLWEKDLETYFQASPSLVGDRLHLLSEKGLMFIVAAAAEFEELNRCELAESCFASPAFADGRIYIRTAENLYCIAAQAEQL